MNCDVKPMNITPPQVSMPEPFAQVMQVWPSVATDRAFGKKSPKMSIEAQNDGLHDDLPFQLGEV